MNAVFCVSLRIGQTRIIEVILKVKKIALRTDFKSNFIL